MRFSYRAISATGRRSKGQLDAANPDDLEIRLKHMGLDLIRAEPWHNGLSFGNKAISRRDLILFCFHLEQLTRAGIPILDGLGDLREAVNTLRLRAVIASLIADIEGGQTLSQAMATHPSAFDRVFVSLIRAGEASGQLPEILAKLGESLKWEDELAAQRGRLLLYPAFVATVVLAALTFLMLYLVPQLKSFVKGMGQTLPQHTRLLFSLSELLADYWYLFASLPIAILLLARLILVRSQHARIALDRLKLRLPVLGKILNKVILARFANVLAMLYAAGIPVLDALKIARGVVDNRLIRQTLLQVERAIGEGHSLAGACQATGLFPSLVSRMLRVGENTGNLDNALLHIGYFYGRDVREAVARAQSMVEPTLTVCLGLMLAWIMLAVLGPIYDVISRIRP